MDPRRPRLVEDQLRQVRAKAAAKACTQLRQVRTKAAAKACTRLRQVRAKAAAMARRTGMGLSICRK